MAGFAGNAVSTAQTMPIATAGHTAKIAAAFVMLLGLGLVWGVGFASPSTLHNAAHDSRHTLAFPCH